MKTLLAGKLTYLAAAAMALYAVLGLVLGLMGVDEAVKLLLEAAGLVGLRRAVATK